MPPLSYYRILDFDKPHNALTDDTIVVYNLPLGRLELRLKGSHLEVSCHPNQSHSRLTIEPVVSNQIRLRLEPEIKDIAL